MRQRSSIVVASVGRQVLPITDTETVSSLLWFATIQGIESKQDLGGLAPKDCFIWSLAYARMKIQRYLECALA